MARSGQAIVRVMRIATASGFRWSSKRRRFERPLWERAKGTLIALAGAAAAMGPVLFRGDSTSVVEAVSAGGTAAAVFVALYAVTRSADR